MNTMNFHSSVACERDQDSLPTVSDEVLHGNCTMTILIEAFKKADAKKYNMSFMDMEEVCSFVISRMLIFNVLFSSKLTPLLKRHRRFGLMFCTHTLIWQ